ncbi:MAG: OsmC family protein [Bdellovibrionaceae bacterium]|nr:OsmC family protein [Pseudobdellovibrionaceae bacterium]
MIQYPISFSANAKSVSGIQKVWQFSSQNLQNECAIPPEFDGPGGAFSPEDLFAQALTNCFVATFKVYAEKSKLMFGEVRVDTELIVDNDESGKPVMKTCFLNVIISGCERPDRIRGIAEKAFQSGFIINSVKTDIHFDLEVSGL